MKNTYSMTQTDTSVSSPPKRLECIIIRNYPARCNKVIKVFKDYIESTPHITKYCNIKHDKYINNTELSKWHLCNVKPENIYVFPFYQYEDYYFLELCFSMKNANTNGILTDFVRFPTFYMRSENPLEYYSSFGNILIDQNNLKYI